MTSVLIIEDSHVVTALLESALASDTCSVHTTKRWQAGLQLLREQAFDVVIADIVMPDIVGFEVIMEINSLVPRPRVIAMSGYTGSQDHVYQSVMADSLSVQCLLYKPFSMKKLLESVFLCEV